MQVPKAAAIYIDGCLSLVYETLATMLKEDEQLMQTVSFILFAVALLGHPNIQYVLYKMHPCLLKITFLCN